MRFGFENLVPSKNDHLFSIEDAIAAECMIVSTIDEAEDAIRTAEEILHSIEHLTMLDTVIQKYGYTRSVESLYGNTLAQYGIEVTAREIGGVVKKGITAFIHALQMIVSKVLDFAEAFFSRSQRSYTKQLAFIKDKVESMQNEKFHSTSASRFIKTCEIVQKHFEVTYDDVVKPSLSTAPIDSLRATYLQRFNSKVPAGGMKVGPNYQTPYEDRQRKMSSLQTLGFTSYDRFVEVDSKIKSCMQTGNSVLTNLKTVSKETRKLVSGLTNNRFRNDAGPTVESQAVFVYTRIIFNDIKYLKSVEQRFRRLVTEIAKKAQGYSVATQEEQPQQEAQPEEQPTPDTEKK